MKKIANCSFFNEWDIDYINDYKELIIKVYSNLIKFPLLDNMITIDFNYKSTHLKVPVNIYFKLCYLLAQELADYKDKIYFYSKAKTIYEKKYFEIFREKFKNEYSIASKFYVKGCRPKLRTFHSDEVADFIHNNLSNKMSLLPKNIIENRNKQISIGMKNYHRRKNGK